MQRSLQNPSEMLNTIKVIQFLGEFFLHSKFKLDAELLSEYLGAFQTLKFFFRIQSFHTQANIYVESQKDLSPQSSFIAPIQKDELSDKTSQTGETMHSSSRKPPNPMKGKCQSLMESILNIPVIQKCSPKNFLNILGEILILLRPLITILAIRIFGLKSYKPLLVSLMIDMSVTLVLHRGLRAQSQSQKSEVVKRRKEILIRYLFKDPIYEKVREKLISPLISKVFRYGALYKFIMSLFDMQSSLTLNL